MLMKLIQAKKLDHALHCLSEDDFTILAGGTDFYPSLQDHAVQSNVLDIWGIDELKTITDDGDMLRIGALATWSQLIDHELPASFDGLKLAAREVGSVQIQNRATLVGNLCNASPAADGVPPLLTLDAQVELVSSSSSRTMPLSQFVQGNRKIAKQANEMVSAILIPKASTAGSSSFLKLGARKYLVISISMVAVRIACDNNNCISDAAISVGSCSLVAQRLSELEQSLIGELVNSAVVGKVTVRSLSELSPIDDVRASKQYRLDATVELVRRAIVATTDTLS